MKKNKKYITEHDYINYEDLLHKLGYRRYKPKLGNLGRALLEASNKNRGSNNILKRFWDAYFRRLRQEKRKKNELQKQDC